MVMAKRKSAGGAADQAPTAKKQKVVQAAMFDKKCGLIAEGINQAANLHHDVRNMLCASINTSLVVIASERHEYSKQLISHMKETLESVRSNFNDQVDDFASQEVRATDELKSRQNELLVVKQTTVEKKSALDGAKKGLQDAKDAQEAAKKALQNAEVTLKKADSSRLDAEKQKFAFSSALELLPKFRAGSEESKDKLNGDIKFVTKIAKEARLDQTMVEMVPITFRKAAADRTSFDTIMLDSFEDAMKKHFVVVNAATEATESLRAEVEESLVQAQQVVDAAPKNEEDCKEELTKKEDEYTDAQVNIAQLESDIKGTFSQLKSLAISLAGCRKDHDDLVKGPIKALEDLEAFDGPKAQHKEGQGVTIGEVP